MNIKKIIKEEMDGFEWMKNVNTLSFEYLKGKALEFDPFIKDQDTLDKVLSVLKSLGFSYGNWAYEMEWDYDHIEGMYLADNRQIIWTGWIDENYEEHISDYVGRPVEVLDGWSILGGSINEDFDWVGNIPAGPDLEKKMTWKEIVEFLKERFEGTRFWVDVNGYDDDEYPYISIEDETGTYEDWYGGEVTTLGQVVDGIKETCEDHGSEDIRLEYCELYDTIIGYLK